MGTERISALSRMSWLGDYFASMHLTYYIVLYCTNLKTFGLSRVKVLWASVCFLFTGGSGLSRTLTRDFYFYASTMK